MKLCISTVIKNEHLYLDEWIRYHINLGIDHIFIFEDINSDTHKNITDKYKEVSLNNINIFLFDKYKKQPNWNISRQSIYNKEIIKWIKNNYNYDWCFIIDCDEYITLENEAKNIKSVIQEYNDYDVVILNWQNYNANGHIYKPNYNEHGLIETYKQKCGSSITDPKWKNTKLMYKLSTFNCNYYLGIHLCCDLCKYCKTDFSKELNNICYKNIYLRHYITKSWEEYVYKLNIRGMFNKSHRGYKEFFEMNPDMKSIQKELMDIKDKIIKEST